jgi:autotransporter-associated beta strand protein
VGGGATLDVSGATGGGLTLLPTQSLTFAGTATVLGNVSVPSNATLLSTGTAGYATLSVGSLSLGGTTRLRVGTVGSSFDRFLVNGNLELGSGSVLDVLDGKYSGLQAMDEGTYNLLTATGSLTTSGSLSFNLLTEGGTYSTTGSLVGGGTLGPLEGAVVSSDFLPSLTINGSTLQLRLTFNGLFATWDGAAGDLLWNSAGNWDKGAAPGMGPKSRGNDRAVLNAANAAAAGVVTLPNQRVDLRSLSLNAPEGSGFTLVSAGTASQLGLFSRSVPALLTVVGGTHTLGMPVYLESSVTVNVGSASAGLAVTGAGALLEQGTAAALLKTGPGVLALATANTYSGGTTVAEGTLLARHAAALGAGPVNVTGGLLDVTAAALSTGSLSLDAASLNLSVGNVLTASGAALLNGTVNVSGPVSAATVGRYTLLSGTSVGGSLVQGSIP